MIEVVVVMAIIATLTGIMIPFIYRVWESTEIDTTRERMTDLKKAMVGDPKLIQNGVRTHYGYIGDVGQLPSSLENLVTNTDGVSNWKGPYLPSGFDISKYNKDTWGTAIQYSPATVAGRRVSATLISYGPNGANNGGSGDDIADSIFQISPLEVAPVSLIQGNVNVTFQSAPLANRIFSIGVSARYRNGTGVLVTDTCCDSAIKTISGTAGNTQVNYTQNFSCAPPNNLPVGTAYLYPGLYSDSSCATSLGGSPLEVAINVHGSTIFSTMQIQAVP
ncbi:MAG: type II secretion system protein GspG [Nitrospirae bacterium]|nr:type II secretion system protein GspG [Nitrospirota bacterium]